MNASSSYRSQTSDGDDDSSITNNKNEVHSIRSWSQIVYVLFRFFFFLYSIIYPFCLSSCQCTTQNDLVNIAFSFISFVYISKENNYACIGLLFLWWIISLFINVVYWCYTEFFCLFVCWILFFSFFLSFWIVMHSHAYLYHNKTNSRNKLEIISINYHKTLNGGLKELQVFSLSNTEKAGVTVIV
jgi:hypothetical protein